MSGLHLSQRYKDWQFIQGEEHKEQDDDLISRQAVNEIINDIRDCISVEGYCAILERLKKLPSVNSQESIAQERYEDLCEYFGKTKDILKNRDDFKAWLGRVKWHIRKAEELYEKYEQEPKTGHCKDCKYFEYNSVAKVDGIPLIVAHEICKRWGDGCKTSENGYCFLFEPQESEGEE